MIKNKRLMILGAGPFQAPAIRKAVELGCYVITVDYIPHNIGHQFGHKYINCSTTDKESVLRAAIELKIDGICTFSSDVAVPTMAYVSDQLGLPGTTLAIAETMATKHLFRKFLKDAGISQPAFISGEIFSSIEEGIHHLSPPLIFKPVDASGSRGLTYINQIDLQSCEKAFQKARDFSRSSTVCVEEIVPGIEVGGDAILIDGRVAFIAITHKYLNGFVVTGHSLPTDIPTEAQERVIDHIETICKALKYNTGPLNFDAIVNKNTIVILEISARNGGNGIPSIIKQRTGVDVEKAAIFLALGENPCLNKSSKKQSCVGSFVFGSSKKGILKFITPPEILKQDITEIYDVFYAKKIGDHLEPFNHNGNFIGIVMFKTYDTKDYGRLSLNIKSALNLFIEPN